MVDTMTNQEILEKAITKAIEGGWNRRIRNFYVGALDADENGDHEQYDYESIIFNHDFCKAIFGTNEVCFSCGLENKHDPYCAEQTFYDEAWKYRLREMVLEENPVEYLGDYV